MAGILQHLRSSTLDKRPSPGSMVDGQIAINYASGSPGMFFKDSNGNLVKVGPVHVGSGTPNASPASGGTAGNSVGEQWLDTSGGTYVFKVWDGSAWRSEAGEFVNVTGDTMTGTLTIGSGATIAFEGSTDDGFETTLTVVDPTADRTITFPNVSGTVVTTGDTGTVTSTMITDGTIVNGDVNASAAIAGTKISPDFGSQNVTTTGTVTGASLTPTSSTVPTNGVYLPAANSVAISTGGSGRLFVDANGIVSVVGTATTNINFTVNGAASSSTSRNWNFPGLLLRRTASNTTSAKQISFLLDGDTENDTTLTNYLNIWGTYSGTPTTSSTSTGLSASMNLGAPNAFIAHTNGNERLRITSAGNVGIGTASPGGTLDIKAAASTAPLIVQGPSSEFARIDSSGRLLVGTSTARANLFNAVISPGLQLEAAGSLTSPNRIISVVNNFATNGDGGGVLALCRSKGGTLTSNTLVTSGDQLGRFDFQGNDGTQFVSGAMIEAYVDGTSGADDMPGRLVFSTTADGASSPTERMRITQTGYLKASDTGLYHDSSSSGTFHEFRTSISSAALVATASNASYTGNMYHGSSTRASSTVFSLLKLETNTFSDVEFNLRGDGNAFADGSWSGGGADYAEYFEWSDSNPDEEDRRGISVVLDGDKIREAVAGEDPIGVISGNPSVVGDAAWNKWSGKYLRDEFGTYIQEDYEVEDEDGNTVIQQRRKLNPAYDPDVEYLSREERPEWDCVGLMGKLRIRKGQVTGSRWIKMRDINDSVEEWLVR